MTHDNENADPGSGPDPGGGPPMPPEQASGNQPSVTPPPAEPMPAGAAQPSLWERIKKMFGG
jgi:hypothetical protein